MGPPLPDPVAAGFGQSPVNIVSRKVKIVGMYTRFRFVMTCSHACFITEWQLCCHKRKQRSVMIRVSRPFLAPAKNRNWDLAFAKLRLVLISSYHGETVALQVFS